MHEASTSLVYGLRMPQFDHKPRLGGFLGARDRGVIGEICAFGAR